MIMCTRTQYKNNDKNRSIVRIQTTANSLTFTGEAATAQ